MTNIIPPAKCGICDGPLQELEGISQKDKTPYHFLKCPHEDCEFYWNFPIKPPLKKIDPNIEAERCIYVKLLEMEKTLKNIEAQIIGKFIDTKDL